MGNEVSDSTMRDPDTPLPEGWRWVRLGEMCRIDSNQVLPNTTAAKQLTYIGLEHIEGETGKIIGIVRGDNSSSIQSMTFRFDSRHVLYGKLRPYLNKVVLPDFEGRCTTELLPLLPECECARDYLAWFFRRSETVAEAMRHKTGTRMPRADMKELFKMLVPLPSLPEQKRIAAKVQVLVEDVEHARTVCEAQLEAAKALPFSYLRQVFESEEAKKWERESLRETLISYDNGLWGFQDPVNGVQVIRSTNFRNNGSISMDNIAKVFPNIQNIENKKLQRGDILLERAGGGPKQPVGRVVLFDLEGKFYFGNFISRLRCKGNAEAEFLFLYLFYVHVKGGTLVLQDRTTGIRNLRFGEYLQLPIPFPSLHIQKHIASYLEEKISQAEKVKAAIEKQLETINALPQAILRKAFSGEL